MQPDRRPFTHAAALFLGLAACNGQGGTSEAEIVRRAEEHIRNELGLSEQAALFTDVRIAGREDGDVVVCGSVSGTRPDGPPIAPRRFIIQLEPARVIRWETGDSPHGTETPNFPIVWTQMCR